VLITIESSTVRQYRRLDAQLDSAVADGRKKQISVAVAVAVAVTWTWLGNAYKSFVETLSVGYLIPTYYLA
jgi:hypothetical protein